MLRKLTDFEAPPEALVLATVYTRLNATTSAEQESAAELVRQATRVAEEIVGRPLWHREYEERLTGDSTPTIYLEARPIDTVSEVKFDEDDPLEAEEFLVYSERGYLFLLDGEVWTRSPNLWKVTYTGGYWIPTNGATPPDGAALIEHEGAHLQRAIWEIVRFSYAAEQKDPTIKAERIGGRAPVSTEYETGCHVPESSLKILRKIKGIAL